MDYVPYAVPFFLLAILIELAYGIIKKNNTYRLNDAISSLFMGSLKVSKQTYYYWLGWLRILSQLKLIMRYGEWTPPLLSFGCLRLYFMIFVITGFIESVMRDKFFGLRMWLIIKAKITTFRTALQANWHRSILLLGSFYIPVFLLGVPSYVFVSVASINLVYQFWVHSEHIPKLGWYEKFFVTASNHRVHHAQNDNYIDKNYGGVFIIWDRMFGTYQGRR